MAETVKESTCNVGGPGSIPGSGRSPGEGNGYPLQYSCCCPLWYDYKELHLAATVLGSNPALLIPVRVTLAQRSLGPLICNVGIMVPTTADFTGL